MRLFRNEAGALLTLPHHSNIAGFVTFDAGARPKPILVMELVQGNTLEHLIDHRALNMRLPLDVLEGMAAGLEAMHEAGLAHLDVPRCGTPVPSAITWIRAPPMFMPFPAWPTNF